MELDKVVDAGGDASSANNSKETLKGNANDPMTSEKLVKTDQEHEKIDKDNSESFTESETETSENYENDEKKSSATAEQAVITTAEETTTKSEEAKEAATTTVVTDLPSMDENKPSSSFASLQGSMSLLNNKLGELQRNLEEKAKKQEVESNSVTTTDTANQSIENVVELQSQLQQKCEIFHKSTQTVQLKCECGISYTTCCDLRRSLDSAIKQLSRNKYPQLMQDLNLILSGNGSSSSNNNNNKKPAFNRRRYRPNNAGHSKKDFVNTHGHSQAHGHAKTNDRDRDHYHDNTHDQTYNRAKIQGHAKIHVNSNAKSAKTYNHGHANGGEKVHTSKMDKKETSQAASGSGSSNSKMTMTNRKTNEQVNSKHANNVENVKHEVNFKRATRRRRNYYRNKFYNNNDNTNEPNDQKQNMKNQQKMKSINTQEILVKYINDIVKEYCTDENIEFKEEFDYKTNDDLQMYADKLVNAGIGRIVDAPIRINRNKNYQAFIEMSTDRETIERDGYISIPVARQYAFEGNIVRAFVLNAKKPRKSTISSSVDNMMTTDTAQKSSTDTAAAAVATSSTTDDKIDNNNENLLVANIDAIDNDDEEIIIPDDIDVDIDTLAKNANNCPKAFVIKILEKNNKQEIVGNINFKNIVQISESDDVKKKYFKFNPFDRRMPHIYIEVFSTELSSKNNKYLYTCQILRVDVNGFHIGKLLEPLGESGELSSEIKAILQHNGLKHIRPYDERFNNLNIKELEGKTYDNTEREDLTKQCIFTIDPLTARDLDDALSVEEITPNEYEVGVHISDVSHYIKENCELDNIVKERCTSIYMVNEVIHMLPQPLCLHCSLLPDQNKYAFSVFWRFSHDGKILNAQPRFTRTIIRSCAQLAYEHAQYIIDNPNDEHDKIDEAKILPNIVNDYTVADIVKRIRILYNLSVIMRKERFDAGALTIKNPKLRFNFDKDTMEPVSYEIEKRLEANFMIEEFMLLANQAVAKFIYESYPDISILRHHSPPLLNSMRNLCQCMSEYGINIDYSSSKAVQQSVERICQEAEDPIAMNTFLSVLLMKPMTRAK